MGTGNVTVNKVINASDIDNMSFLPSSNWNGSTSFSYKAYDSYVNESNSSIANIVVKPINDALSAKDDVVSTDEESSIIINVRSNDTDVKPSTDDLVIASVTQADHGVVINNGNGRVTYTPNLNWNGTDTFTYLIKDEDNASDTGTVTVNPIKDIPTPPSSISISGSSPYRGGENVTVSWSGASDVDGDSLTYNLDYFDSSNWNAIETGIEAESQVVSIASINTKISKIRVRSYDGIAFYPTI